MSDKVKAAVEERKKKRLQEMIAENEAKKAKVDSAVNARASILASSVDENYISSFIQDSNAFLAQSQTDWEGLSWQSATDKQKAEERKKAAADLDQRKTAVRAYLNLNKGRLKEDAYNDFTTYLDTADYNGILDRFSKASNHYSRYESQEMYDIYQLSTDEVWKKMQSGEETAYTTQDGQEITWKALYDSKSLNDLYDYYSSLDDWEAKSKGVTSTFDMRSDYQTVWQLMYNSDPKSWAEAEKAGWSKEQYDATAKKRDEDRAYIGQKYGVDFNAYDVQDQLNRIANDLYLKKGEVDTFEYMDDTTPEEQAVLNYMFNTYGRDYALSWHNSREDTYEQRYLADMQQKWQKFGQEQAFWASVASVGTNLLAGAEWLIDAGVYLGTGRMDENRMAMRTNAARGGVMSTVDWEIAGWDAFDFIYSTSMSMADSVTSMGLFGPAGGFALGLSAAGHATQDALDRGLSNSQAFWAGLMGGTFECLFESVSIGSFKALKELPAYTFKDIAKNIGKSMLVNASEEALTEIANIAYDTVFNGDLANYTWEDLKNGAWKDAVLQVAEAAGSGALMGFGFGAVGSADSAVGVASSQKADAKRMNALAKGTLEADGGVDSLLNLANEVAGVSSGKAKDKIEKLSGKVGSKATAKNVGQLYKAIGKSSNTQSKADIVKSLERKGVASREAGIIADSIIELNKRNGITGDNASLMADDLVTAAYGNEQSKKTQKLLETGEVQGAVKTALNDIVLNEKSTMSQRSQKMDDVVTNIAVNMAKTAFLKQSAEKEFAPKGEYDVSAEGKAIRKGTDELIDIKGVASIRKGELLLDIGDGKTINARDVAYANGNDALIYEAIANLGDNINAETANALIAKFDGGNAEVFARGIAQAYTYGFYGIDSSELMGKKSLASELTEAQRNDAYDLGMKYRPTKDLADKAAARVSKAPAEKGVYYRDKDGKATDISTYLKESGIKLNDAQKTGIEAMRKLSEMLGVRFNVFESWVENGTSYYLNEDGVKTKGNPNGFYDTTTGEIYIDLHAGNNYQGTILFTVAHELTHFMRQWSPEHFTKISDIVFKHGGMKGDVSKLIALKQKKAKENGKPISYDTAVEEVVADGMETILKDGKVVEFMAEVKQKDHAAWQKLKAWFKNLAKFLRKMVVAYRSHSAQTYEGAKVADFAEDLLRQIEQIYAEGAVEAGENYQAAMESVVEAKAEAVSSEEIITDGAVVTDGEGTKFSIKSMKHDIAEGQMFEDLKNYCGWTQSQVNELRNNLNDLVEYMTPHRDILDMNETYGREGRRFSPYKPNSDPLYKISMDFSTLCSKRLLTQYVIENLQLRENRPMSAEEQMAIRDMLNEYRKVEKGLQVACAMCYVEAARLKSPKQIQRWLADPEPHLRNYFALKNSEFNAKVKEAQANFKESRGYARNAPKKDMKQADVKELNKIGPKMRSQYQLSAEEQAIVEKAKTLPNSTYLTAGNLADLSETDPAIYLAYTSFVRTATRSKSLETDEPYYYGDSNRDNGNGIIVSDSFIESVNRENGMRFSSWSDWRIQHLLDYITAVIDNSVRGAAMHGYTKFGEEVRVLGKTGMMFNMSGVAGTQTGLNPDGSLNFSETESIDVNEAIQLREEFPEHAGLQCIGVSNEHIIALLKSDIIDYVIPYHVSGLNKALRTMAKIQGWADYTGTQNASIDKSIKKENAVDPEHWHEEPVFSEFFVGYDTGMSGIDAMRASAEQYKQMCKDRGLTPKFNQFANESNYWKLLIDRKMINQQTGELIRQKAVTPTFDFDTIKAVVDRYVDNYDSGLEARALNHIVENWDSIPQRIKDLKKKDGTKAKKTKKAVDTLANQTLAAQPVDNTKLSMRESVEETKDLLAYHNITAQLLLDVLKRNSLLMPSLAVTNKGMIDFGEISLLFDKSTIDPALSGENKLYGADAWTPTQTKLKKNAKFDSDKTVRAVNNVKNRIGSKFVSKLFNVTAKQFKDTIVKADGSIYDAYAHNIGMQTAYAMEQGIIAKIPTNKDGSINEEALKKQLNKELDTDNGWRQYKKWLNNISDTIITSYDTATNEDILNNMKAQPATAKTFKLSETGELVVPAVEYSSIDEVRKNKNRLSENAAEATKAVADEFLAFAKKVGDTKSVVDAINSAFANRYSTADIVKTFNSNGIKISNQTASELQSLYKKAVELPTQYFEAKPGREIGLDEVKAVVMPAGESYAELKGKLEDAGISVVEYKAGSNESRVEAMNSMESLKFSDRDFLADDNLKSNYTVSEISEMFDAWNSDADTAELAKKVFAKLQSIQDEYTNASWGKPYGIRFLTNEELEKSYHFAANGLFKPERNSDLYGITYNLDSFKKFDDQRKANILLHEAIHACTVNYIKSAENRVPKHTDVLSFKAGEDWSTEAKAGLALIQIFEQVRTAENRTEYGQKNVYEMTAELANPEFRSLLKKQNLWDRVVNAIKRILGIDTKANALDASSKALEQILEVDNVRYSDRDLKFQDRVEDSVSNRNLLANAFEGLAQTDIERNKIQEYKSKISLIDAEEKKLRELNEQIKELSFSKGPRDTKKIKSLQFDANQAANRINTYDKQLLRLEASKPLQDVLAREKKRAYKKAEQEGKKALAKQREKAAKTQRALLEKWQDSRKKAVENREKTAMRHKIQRVVGELNDLLLSNDKKRHVPENLKKAVADALSLVNMDTVGAEERAAKYAALIANETDPDKIAAYTVTMENILRQGEKIGQRLKELRDAYEEFSESDDPDIANAYDPVIAGSLKELASSIGNTSLRNMTIDQLQDVYDMYKMVLTRVRDANKSFTNARNEAIGSLASRVVGEVRKIRGERKYRLALLDAVRSFSWNNLKPVYAMERIGSNTLVETFNSVRAGEDTWAKDVGEARAYYLDKSKKHGYDSWDFDKKYTFKSTSGLEFELTLEQIMSLYAYSKREQALDHLRLGGFVFDSNIETYKEKDGNNGKSILKYKVNTAEAHQISADILAEITGKLSSEQKSFVDDMQEYLSTVMGAKGNEVTMKMYGVKLFKEKFYFPLKSAKQFLFEQNEVAGEVRIKNSGFTNKVVARANNPVILNGFMDVWSDHVNDMSMYHSFVLPLEDFNRIFNYKSPKKEGQPPVSVKGTIQGAYSPAAVDYVKQLITDLNGGAMSDPRETLGKRLAAKFKKAKVFASLSVVIQQPSAIGRAFALVDLKHFRPTKDGMNHDQLWYELKQYAPVAVIKEMGYFDTNMGRSTRDFIKAKEYSGFKDKVKGFFTDAEYRDEKLSRLPALADEVTWCAIWNAVKRETVSTHKDLRPGSEEFLKAAGERFTEVVTKTQVYDSVLARSANMRSKSGLMSMITSFMAEPTTSINMLEDAILKGKRGNRGYAARAFASVATSIILNNALVAIVYAMRDDDEDETFIEKYMQALVSGMMDDINPLTYYPYLKDIWSLFQGYDVERADMSLVSDLADATKGLIKAYTTDDGDVVGAWHDLAGTFANLGGIPMDNIRRDINGGINFVKTLIEDVNGRATTWGSMGDTLLATVKDSTPIWGWFPDKKKSDNLYDAITKGDTAYVNRMKGSYKTEDAYHSAVRTALRENDPRIKEAAIAGYNGDPSERVRIAKLIIADGFAQDDVVAAINAEINKMKPDEGGSDPKKKGFYTAEDFAKEIANGDQAAANAAKSDIIQTAQKNGKTEEEAEDSFKSSVKTELKELYLAGKISESKVVDALVTYCGIEREDAVADIQYWDFKQDHPDVFADDAWVDEYYNEVASSGISIDMFISYRNQVKGIEGEDKKEKRMAVIHSLPISNAQKDALYYAEGWAASKLWQAPWH